MTRKGILTDAELQEIKDEVQTWSDKNTKKLIEKAIKEVQGMVGMRGSSKELQSQNIRLKTWKDGARKTYEDRYGNIFFGEDTQTPDGTTQINFAVDLAYNNEDFGGGDVLFGDNTDGVSNIKYDRSEGQWQFRLGQTVTAYQDTDGTFKALAGEFGGWTITSTAIQKLTAGVGIVLDSSIPMIKLGNISGAHTQFDGANQRIRSSNFVAGQTGFNISSTTGDAEFNNITARGELKTFLLTAENQMVVGGAIIVSKDSGKLGAAVGVSDTTVNFGKAMTVNDWIKIQGPDTSGSYMLEWMKVGTLVSGTTYNVTRNVDGSGANAWATDTPFAVIGQSGSHRIELIAGTSGTIKIVTQGAAWNTWTIQAEMSAVNGAITAGGGNVILDASGISIVSLAAYQAKNSLKFISGSTVFSEVWGTQDAGGFYSILNIKANSITNRSSTLNITADAPTGRSSTINIGTYINGTIQIGLSLYNGELLINGNLNTNSIITSSTYTPTLTNVTNITSSTAYVAQYIRVGSVVTVCGLLQIDPASVAQCLMRMSLPLASNFAGGIEAGGYIGTSASEGNSGVIYADAVNNVAEIQWYATNDTQQYYVYHYTYLIV